jgi:hypothetical protein
MTSAGQPRRNEKRAKLIPRLVDAVVRGCHIYDHFIFTVFIMVISAKEN